MTDELRRLSASGKLGYEPGHGFVALVRPQSPSATCAEVIDQAGVERFSTNVATIAPQTLEVMVILQEASG